MGRLVSVAETSKPKGTKVNNNNNKKKKTGIRVVYISNPVRVWASESEFLPLVQKLTGRGSDDGRDNMYKCSPLIGTAIESCQSSEQPRPDRGDGAAIAPSLSCGVDDGPLEWQLDGEYNLSDWIF